MSISPRRIRQFQRTILNYYRTHRRDLPWRITRDPYKILVSEVMLQQTQVARVLKKYPEFLRAFPDFKVLVRAPLRRVLKVWQGMGYNRRAIALKKIAEIVMEKHKGRLPSDPKTLMTFPGIGPTTANSIVAFAFNKPGVFIETNIRRVFIHHFFRGQTKITDRQILYYVGRMVDRVQPRRWYWALMDYGAMLRQKVENPNRRSQHYKAQSKFEGSNRQTRGALIKLLVAKRQLTLAQMSKMLKKPRQDLLKNLRTLNKEGFIRTQGLWYTLSI